MTLGTRRLGQSPLQWLKNSEARRVRDFQILRSVPDPDDDPDDEDGPRGSSSNPSTRFQP